MNASVFVKIHTASGFVQRTIRINNDENIESLKHRIKEETQGVNNHNFILKDENGRGILDQTLIKDVPGYDNDDDTLTLTLHFKSGGGRRYKRKVKKTKKLNKQKKGKSKGRKSKRSRRH